MKAIETVYYIRNKYVNDTNFPLDEEAEKIVGSCYQAKEDILLASSTPEGRAGILTEVSYVTDDLALFRVLSTDPAAWESFLVALRVNKVTARDIQSVRSIVGAAYKRLLKEAQAEYLEEQESTTIRGVKSFTVEHGRDGMILRILLREG